jgi:hypothetical protein
MQQGRYCPVLFVLAIVTACTGTYAPLPTQGAAPGTPILRTDACVGSGFRGSNGHGVTCPGTPTCGCDAPQVCCIARIDAQQGVCTALAACRELALACDGPEDCGAGVCCLDTGAGGGTTCRARTDCASGQMWLCRTDADCAGNPGGAFCRPADFGTAGVEDRGLDGLLGVCQS